MISLNYARVAWLVVAYWNFYRDTHYQPPRHFEIKGFSQIYLHLGKILTGALKFLEVKVNIYLGMHKYIFTAQAPRCTSEIQAIILYL